jgi:hypothetical protein
MEAVSMNPKYVDHPAPSAVFMMLLLLAVGFVLFSIPAVLGAAAHVRHPAFFLAVTGLTLAILCFYFWPLYSTYYTLSAEGLLVRYGPWRRLYPWSDFINAYWQKGMFATRIGWPTVTPCVRLTNAVLLKRRKARFGLFLTPNDPKAFLLKVTEFAPDLTRETIL